MDQKSNNALNQAQNERQPSCEKLQKLVPQQAVCVIQKYETAENFLKCMSSAAQTYAAQYPDRVYTSEISITRLKLAFGEQVLRVWIKAQIENLNDFVGVKEQMKMNLDQMRELADIICIDYGYLRAPEVLLFFHKLKGGEYGQFYGSVDPQLIAAALYQYSKDRQVAIARIEADTARRQLEAQRVEWAKNAITREEFERRKSAKE